MTFLLCLSFLVDEFDCSLQCNRHRVFLLRDRHVLTVVENVWAEAACSDGYLATFEITQFARKLEEFQSFFQGNGLDTLVGWQLGELRLVLVIGSSNLYDRTETTNLNEYWASRLWIITKLSLASFMLAACVHHLVNAQQARRVLDRLVGFKLSPVLWRKVKPALSAGRVQSVAVRLIVEREREIQKFKSEPYYRVVAIFALLNEDGNATEVNVLKERFLKVQKLFNSKKKNKIKLALEILDAEIFCVIQN